MQLGRTETFSNVLQKFISISNPGESKWSEFETEKAQSKYTLNGLASSVNILGKL